MATGKRNDLDLDGGVETVQHDKNGKLIGNAAECGWLKDGRYFCLLVRNDEWL